MEKLLIYPYDFEFLPSVKRIIAEKNYVITGVVSFAGWGYAGKDSGNIIYGDKNGIMVSTDFYAELTKCDTVLFCKSNNVIVDFNSIIEKMKESINLKKM